MHPEHSWSLLDKRPCLVYLPQHDNYIVYWQGIAMTHSMAFALAMQSFGVKITSEMSKTLKDEFDQMYFAGAFGHREWDSLIRSDRLGNSKDFIRYMKKIFSEVSKRTILNDGVNIIEVLKWLNYNRARVHVDEQ